VITADRLQFTVATDPAELDQVHRINYRTFVEEIPQHPANEDRTLVDRFNDNSTYFVCKRGNRVIGMVAMHERRPFSLDAKLPDLDTYLPAGCRPCEIRLLAVEPEHRNGVVFRGLIRELSRHCIARGFDAVVISGTVRQLKLYRHLGFVAFGPLVGTAEAQYQPMYLTLDAFRRAALDVVESEAPVRTLRFAPGPVDMHPDVQAALALPPVSHRESAFMHELRETKALLCRLSQAQNAEVLVGSGTLANDVVAMQIASLHQPGIVLSNGEFGERLTDHAARAGLQFATERQPWGQGFTRDTLATIVNRHPEARWLWMVHHETSTGVLNDLLEAAALCADRDMKLCADCVSSLGVVPIDLRDVHLATGVSGKGLASAAGLAIVFHRDAPRTFPRIPRYLDLSLYVAANGVPFTLPSAQLSALRVAVSLASRPGTYDRLADLSARLRQGLRQLGLEPLADDAISCPGIVTLDLGTDNSAERIGDGLARAGIALSYQSEYLRSRNWIQVALMGQCSREKITALLESLKGAISAAT
jgi:aspartate aminotransferase-like enzyme/GNAT superfamily N-acetyltransferase